MSRSTDEPTLSALAPAAARLGHALGRPVPLAVACLVALAGLGWIWLVIMVAGWTARGERDQAGDGDRYRAAERMAEPRRRPRQPVQCILVAAAAHRGRPLMRSGGLADKDIC